MTPRHIINSPRVTEPADRRAVGKERSRICDPAAGFPSQVDTRRQHA